MIVAAESPVPAMAIVSGISVSHSLREAIYLNASEEWHIRGNPLGVRSHFLRISPPEVVSVSKP